MLHWPPDREQFDRFATLEAYTSPQGTYRLTFWQGVVPEPTFFVGSSDDCELEIRERANSRPIWTEYVAGIAFIWVYREPSLCGDCPECFGTGHYKGFGGPCPRGCPQKVVTG